MAPKKTKKQAPAAASSSNPARGVAQARISTDVEKKLSRLVENVAQKSYGDEIIAPEQKKQTEKRLRKIYDNLGNEGFTAEQIELALAAIPLNKITLDNALDWLCLNISPNELPLKFSSGFTADDKGGAVQVLTSSTQPTTTGRHLRGEDQNEFSNLVKLDARESRRSDQKADKDWIRQYIAQQEEEESDSHGSEDLDWDDWEDRVNTKTHISSKSMDPVQVAEAFVSAKQAATEAKMRGDKERQAEAGKLIRDLKEKMASLGLNEQDILSSLPQEQTTFQDNKQQDFVVNQKNEKQNVSDSEQIVVEVKETPSEAVFQTPKETSSEVSETVKHEDEELMGMFDEEFEQQTLPESVVKLQRKEEMLPWGMKGGSSERGKSKKSSKVKASIEVQKSPRALLQQYCLKNGWDAPKYEKLRSVPYNYGYTLTVFRPTTGRGKSKKAGGPVTFTFPEHDHVFNSISDAQDGVATWALFSLFPDIPVYQELLEPFRSMWLRWHDQGKTASEPDTESRDSFITSLVHSGNISEVSTVSQPVEAAPKTYEPPRKLTAPKQGHDVSASNRLKLIQESKMKDENYKKMLNARSMLPIASVKGKILENLAAKHVLVVSGETGSGKTTQVPQYILEDMIAANQGGACKIICTQPRRIAAISVAERVATERCEEAGSTVGYQVRLDASWSADTRLLFCTTGILLRRLASDPELSDVSHVVVDEVHERTVLGDFLISLLRDLLAKRNQDGVNPLKVILMSATLDAERFSEYFGGCPVVIARGRTYPVKTFYLEDVYEQLEYRLSSDNPAAIQSRSSYSKKHTHHLVDQNRGRQTLALTGWGDEQILEESAVNPLYDESLYRDYSEKTRKNLGKVNEDVIDYELLEDLIMHINENGEPGALLVFLPGMPEILQLLDRLLVLKDFSGTASEWILPLHSSVAPADQRKVFHVPPNGIRKIVLATNIAETSVTIEDVVHVVDCGKHKENRFEPRRRMSRMVEAWISQANAQQRRGRAGRVKAGNCFCLYTEHRFRKLMRPFQLPEMLRVPLVELCLQIKLLTVENVASFLEKGLDPPKVEAVESAISILHEVGALSEEENITPLGYHLAALPVDVHIGKMILYGVLLGCLGPVLTIAAYLSHKSPFFAPVGQREEAERAKQNFELSENNNIAFKQQSDHLVIVSAYNTWRRISSQGGARAARQFCDSSFLSVPVLNMLREMRIQFAKLLRDIGFITQEEYTTSEADRWLDDINRPFNRNAQCAPVIKAVLCAGLYPNLSAMMEESVKAGHANALNQRAGLASDGKPRWTDGKREVFIHPSSINSKVKEFLHPYLVFHEKVETSKVFLRDTTVMSPFSVLLFGGSIKVQHQIGYVTVDGWMKMNVPARTAVLFKELRNSLDSLLDELTKSPQGLSSLKAKEVVASILELLIEVEQPQR